MRKDEIIELEITDLNNLGCGVGRHEGLVVFVKGAAPLDVLRAKVIKVNKQYAVARIDRILTPSPYRTDSDPCEAPLACGGCVYRHITYERELEIKTDAVRSAFRRMGLSEVEIAPAVSTGKVYGYRNKAQYPVTVTGDGLRAGFYAVKSHTVIPLSNCSIADSEFAPIVKFICDFGNSACWSAYDEKSGQGLLRHIYLRRGGKTGEVLVCLVINGSELPEEQAFAAELSEKFPATVGVMLNINKKNTNLILGKEYRLLCGKGYIEDELCGLRFKVSPESFYQVNRDGAELLYGIAREKTALRGDEVLMDLYCGTGTIGLSMAREAKELRGIEIVEGAVACARENAEANGIKNAEFICGNAGDGEVILRACGGRRPDAVIIDPPRKGSTKELIGTLADLGVPKITYVSCDPDTLARDCVWFKEFGYSIGKVQPVDMFPRTGHVESVVCLKRQIQQ